MQPDPANNKDLEINRLRAELTNLQQWAVENQAQSQQTVSSLREQLGRKEQELVAAQVLINRKEAENALVNATLTIELKSKENELAVMAEIMKRQETFYEAKIALYEARLKVDGKAYGN